MNEYNISYPRPDSFFGWCCMEASCGVNIFAGPCETCPGCNTDSTWRVFNLQYTIRNMEE